MNKTNIEHALISSVIQGFLSATCYFLCGMSFYFIVLCALPGVFLFFGREHAQASEMLKKKKGLSRINWKITLEALAPWVWKKDGRMDFYFPLAASFLQGATWWYVFC